MEFFIPAASSAAVAEETWQSIRKFASESLGWPVSDRRIYEIHYEHNGDSLVATVDQPEPLTKAPVIAILESNSYLICTPERGVLRGMPILAGQPDRVVAFDLHGAGDSGQ